MLPWCGGRGGVCLALLLVLAVGGATAESSNATMTAVEVQVGETHMAEDGMTFVFQTPQMSEHYLLVQFIAELKAKWFLDTYVQLAREFILSFAVLDWELIRGILKGQIPDILSMIQQELAIIAVAAIGLVLSVAMPITGCCVCCCRTCCGKCGARQTAESMRKQSRLAGFCVGGVFFVSLIFLLVGAGSIYTVGSRIPQTGVKVVNMGFSAITDMMAFSDELFMNTEQIAVEDLDFVIGVLNHELDTMVDQLTTPFMESSRPQVEAMLGTIINLADTINVFGEKLALVGATSSNMTQHAGELVNGLMEISTEVMNLKDTCLADSSIPNVICNGLPSSGAVPPAIDFTAMPNFADQLLLLVDATNMDLTQMVNKTNTTYNNIPDRIDQATSGVRNDIQAMLDKVQGLAKEPLQEAKIQFDEATATVDSIKAMMTMVIERPELKQVNLAFLVIAGFVFIIFVLGGVGLLLGFCNCGSEPERRGRIGHCGGNCILSAVGFSYMFSVVFLLFGSILFFVGANLTAVCEPLLDFSVFDEVLDNPKVWGSYPMADVLFQNGTIPLTIKGSLLRCRENKAVWSTLMLDNLVDVEKMVNIKEQMPPLKPMIQQAENTILGIELVNNETQAQMTKMLNPLANDLTGAMDQLNSLVSGMASFDLAPLVAGLNAGASALNIISPALGAVYTAQAVKAQELNDVTIAAINLDLENLDTRSAAMGASVDDLTTAVAGIFDQMVDSQDYMHNAGLRAVIDPTVAYIDKILGYSQQFADHMTGRLANDIGRCKVVWNLYEGLTGTFCGYFLDSFNGLWLSFCIIGVAFVPLTIFGIKLVKYIRQPIAETKEQKYMNELKDVLVCDDMDADNDADEAVCVTEEVTVAVTDDDESQVSDK